MDTEFKPKRELLQFKTTGRIVKYDAGWIYAEIISIDPDVPEDVKPAGLLMVYQKDVKLDKVVDIMVGDIYDFKVSPKIGWSNKNNKPEITWFLKAIREYNTNPWTMLPQCHFQS